MSAAMPQASTNSFIAQSSLTSTLPLVGRILMAAIFLISGWGKITAPAATIGYIASQGLPMPPIALAIAIAVEMAGGVALLLGYRTRLIAAVFFAYCLATAFGFHTQFSDQNQFFHFFKNIAMAGGFLQIVAFGAGRFSLDNGQR